MDKQVLVAYATKYGATAEIAEKIGEVLRQAGLPTDVLPVDRVGDLSAYKAVVLGSAVYIGQWRKEAEVLEGQRDRAGWKVGMAVFKWAHGRGRAGGVDERLALPQGAATYR